MTRRRDHVDSQGTHADAVAVPEKEMGFARLEMELLHHRLARELPVFFMIDTIPVQKNI